MGDESSDLGFGLFMDDSGEFTAVPFAGATFDGRFLAAMAEALSLCVCVCVFCCLFGSFYNLLIYLIVFGLRFSVDQLNLYT